MGWGAGDGPTWELQGLLSGLGLEPKAVGIMGSGKHMGQAGPGFLNPDTTDLLGERALRCGAVLCTAGG